MSLLFEVIKSIRNIRAEKLVKPGDFIDVNFKTNNLNTSIIKSNEIILK